MRLAQLAGFCLSLIVGASEAAECDSAPMKRAVAVWERGHGLALDAAAQGKLFKDYCAAVSWTLAQKDPPPAGLVAGGGERAMTRYLNHAAFHDKSVPFDAYLAEALGHQPFGFPKASPYGRLKVRTTPEDALVSIDEGAFSDAHQYVVLAGNRKVKARKTGHKDCSSAAYVPAGGVAEANCALAPVK